MIELQRGGNAPVEGDQVTVRVDWAGPAGLEADISAFLLGEDGRVSGDHDMIFYNQPSGAGGAVTLQAAVGATTFAVDLARLPESIARITFCLTVDGGRTFADLERADVAVSGGGDIRFAVPREGASEAAMMLGELYRRQGAWKFRAVAQGFNGGLGPLARSFGISVDDEPETPAAAAPPPPPDAAPPPPMPAPVAQPPAPGPNLVKPPPVVLTKPDQIQRVSLTKDTPGQKLIVTATWVDNGDGSDDNDDLDLRVGILRPDGRLDMVHAPDAPGAYDAYPFVRHTGDVKNASLNAPATETVEVNPAIATMMGGRTALVFSVYSAIGNGMVSVASLRPKMRMEFGDQVVECAFDFMLSKVAARSDVYTYVLGTAVVDGDAIYLQPSGMTSKPGSEKTPRLSWDRQGILQVTVDGPPVFKDD